MADSLKLNKGDAIAIRRDHTSKDLLFAVSILPAGGGINATMEGGLAKMTLEEAFEYIRSNIDVG